MEEKKIAGSYIKTIRKITKHNVRHLAFAPVLLLSVIVDPKKLPLVILLEAAFLIAYYRKYFVASRTKDDGSLITALRGQSFPVREVFIKLAKRVVPYELFFMAFCTLFSFADMEGGVEGFADHVRPQRIVGFKTMGELSGMQIANIVCWPLLCILVPLLYYRLISWKMTHEKHGASKQAVISVAYFFFDIVTYLIGVIIGAFGFLIITALIVDCSIKVPENEAVLYAFGSKNRVYMFIALGSAMFWTALMLRDEISKFAIGRFKIRIFVFACMLISGTFMTIYSTKNYVKSTESGMVSVENGRKNEYSYDDITDFKIYCRNDSLALRVYLNDGKSLELLADITEESDPWTKEYESNYHYVEHIAKMLREKGIKGSLDNVEKLGNNVKDMDDEITESFERIREMFAE